MDQRHAWLSLPYEEWPESARAFYRLVYLGLSRARSVEEAGAAAGRSLTVADPERPQQPG